MPRTRSRSSLIAFFDSSCAYRLGRGRRVGVHPGACARSSSIAMEQGDVAHRRGGRAPSGAAGRPPDSTAPARVSSSARTRAASSARSLGASRPDASEAQASASPRVATRLIATSTTAPSAAPTRASELRPASQEPAGAAVETAGDASAASAADHRASTMLPAKMPTGPKQEHVPKLLPGRPIAQPRAPAANPRTAAPRTGQPHDRRAEDHRRALTLCVRAPADHDQGEGEQRNTDDHDRCRDPDREGDRQCEAPAEPERHAGGHVEELRRGAAGRTRSKACVHDPHGRRCQNTPPACSPAARWWGRPYPRRGPRGAGYG